MLGVLEDIFLCADGVDDRIKLGILDAALEGGEEGNMLE